MGQDIKKHQSFQSAKSLKRDLTNSELARFLRNLSHIYRDKMTGNVPLAEALEKLAGQLLAEVAERSPVLQNTELDLRSSVDAERIRTLSAHQIKAKVEDEGVTRGELIDLGHIRFSMPKSRLLKLTRIQIAEAILNVLQHEESLTIISEEARRGGANRSS